MRNVVDAAATRTRSPRHDRRRFSQQARDRALRPWPSSSRTARRDAASDVLRHARSVVRDADFKGSRTLVSELGSLRLRPGRKAVDNLIWPSGLSPIASALFFTRLRKAWISLSRLPGTFGSSDRRPRDGEVPRESCERDVFDMIQHGMNVDEFLCIGRSSPKTSMRSTRSRIRSVSSRDEASQRAGPPPPRPLQAAAPRPGCPKAGS